MRKEKLLELARIQTNLFDYMKKKVEETDREFDLTCKQDQWTSEYFIQDSNVQLNVGVLESQEFNDMLFKPDSLSSHESILFRLFHETAHLIAYFSSEGSDLRADLRAIFSFCLNKRKKEGKGFSKIANKGFIQKTSQAQEDLADLLAMYMLNPYRLRYFLDEISKNDYEEYVSLSKSEKEAILKLILHFNCNLKKVGFGYYLHPPLFKVDVFLYYKVF